jgi:hypothetical protein
MRANVSGRDYLIAAFLEGYAYFLSAGPSLSKSVFGGAPPFVVSGIPETIYDTSALHFVGCISHYDIPPLARHISGIPLFYGFVFDACDLTYELDSPSKVNLMDLSPARPTKGFPYENYPATFPLVPLRLGRKQRMTYDKFSSGYPNLEEDQPADLVVAVPPALSLGVSMWGEYGDADDVTVVFECDLSDRTVRAYNVCT